jgi:hypothetical protein
MMGFGGALAAPTEDDGPEVAVEDDGIKAKVGGSWTMVFTGLIAIGTLQHGVHQHDNSRSIKREIMRLTLAQASSWQAASCVAFSAMNYHLQLVR